MPFLVLALGDTISTLKGSGFCVQDDLAFTAHHVLKPADFTSISGDAVHAIHLVPLKGAPLRIHPDQVEAHPSLDVTVIRAPFSKDFTRFGLGATARVGDDAVMVGYPGIHHQKLDVTVREDYSLSRCDAKAAYATCKVKVDKIADREGKFDVHTFDRPTSVLELIPSKALKEGEVFVETGFSGGPLVRLGTRDVLGIMHQRSDDEPRAFAIDVAELRKLL